MSADSTARAFRKIRDERLYEQFGFETFDLYCRARWGMTAEFVDETCDRILGLAVATWN